MKKFLILPAIATLALAACDNDQPQTPQIEDASAETSNVIVVDTQAAEAMSSDIPVVQTQPENEANSLEAESDVDRSTPRLEEAGGSVAGDNNPVLPGDIAEENIPPPPSREDFTDESCAYDAWIGTKLDEEAIKAEGRPYRIVKPGDAITMDLNPERINVEHADGNVTRVWCG